MAWCYIISKVVSSNLLLLHHHFVQFGVITDTYKKKKRKVSKCQSTRLLAGENFVVAVVNKSCKLSGKYHVHAHFFALEPIPVLSHLASYMKQSINLLV